MVRRTWDFRRIEEIPRRTSFPDLREALTEWLKTPEGTMKLRMEQAWALTEMVAKRGLLGSLGCGSGKTLISYLAPVVLEAERPLLLVPASLREKTLKISIPMLSQHWRLHPHLRVLSYESLSQIGQKDILEKFMPDLIICDECHRCKNKDAGVSRRFLRYFDEFPDTMYVGLSGTVARRSIRDFAHLIALALRDHSPLPQTYTDLEEWADALDEGISDEDRPDPGALLRFCDPGETPRQGFCRRLLESEGYVSTAEPAVTKLDGAVVSIRVIERKVEVPLVVKRAFERLRGKMETPDGGEFTLALDLNGHARELANGFFYRYVWPDGIIDHEWLAARKLIGQFVRHTIRWGAPVSSLQHLGRALVQAGGGKVPRQIYYDTELQVLRACAAGRLVPGPTLKIDFTGCYEKWREIGGRSDPPTEAVWISDFLVDNALDWAKKNVGIIWTDHTALLERLREKGLVCYGGGENDIMYEKGDRTVVASLDAHTEGKDLQMFDKMLFLGVPSSGLIWEQALSRAHRQGQQSDEVQCEVVLHCIELWNAFNQARKDAAYTEETRRETQRLQFADIVVTEEKEVVQRADRARLDPMWCADWPKPKQGEDDGNREGSEESEDDGLDPESHRGRRPSSFDGEVHLQWEDGELVG